ncbi:hypothetical protein TNCT_678291 [Trichonephila clavata]|uniref:Uncharacterized protein n=1 Tax=Trichonephila clavata TaxID=2740835 RepID=A0A8X6JHV2_TRICU|nr:hypothetical protein TNCT_678291 [Trichonephila clavata]
MTCVDETCYCRRQISKAIKLCEGWFYETLLRNFALGDSVCILRGDNGRLIQVPRAFLERPSAHSFPPMPTGAGIYWSIFGSLFCLGRMLMPCVRLVSPLQMTSRADFES